MRRSALCVVSIVSLAACKGTVAGSGPHPGNPDSSVDNLADASPVTPDASVDAAPGATPHTRIFIAGGQDLRRLSSLDGITWSNDTYVAPSGVDNAFGAIAIGNGVIIGVSDTGIYRSTDGKTWTLEPFPTGLAATNTHSAAGMFANGVFSFVATDYAFSSSDGTNWTVIHDTTLGVEHWHGMTFGGGHFVAIGDNCHKVSEDGLHWHDFVTEPGANFAGIAFNNGTFVATGANTANNVGYSEISTDGITFTNGTVVNTTSYSSTFATVVFADGKFITSDCCQVFSSTDGKSWTKQASSSGFNGGHVVYTGDRFVAVVYRTNLLMSLDGASFTNEFTTGDGTNKYDSTMQAPFLTTVAGGYIFP